MGLYVVKSDFDDDNLYYVVDEENFNKKTKLVDDYPEYYRLDLESERQALNVYYGGGGGDEVWNVIEGKDSDFFIAVIKEK